MRDNNLIFDVGMHVGEDTGFYLAKGFRVVAFEANPELVARARQRFSREISTGQLEVVEGAIVDESRKANSTVKFFLNPDKTEWGTVVPDWADRNDHLGIESEVIEVPTICFATCLRTHGVPYYLKIDIEGMDAVCCETLASFESKPAYLSLESEKKDFKKLVEEFDTLEKLGYTDYQVVQQWGVSHITPPYPAKEKDFADYQFIEGASGLFGRELEQPWVSKTDAMSIYRNVFKSYQRYGDQSAIRRNKYSRYALEKFSRLIRKPLPGWYDTHARHPTADSATSVNANLVKEAI